MAKAKYTRGKDGFFRTKAWDGTYNTDGTKHRINLKSDKSSRDLERQVNELNDKVRNRQIVPRDDILFIDYSRMWLKTYKSMRACNTQAMYSNIIEKHFIILGPVRLQDIEHVHFQHLLNSAMDRPRTCQQIAITFRQVIKTAVKSRRLPASALQDICDGVELPRYRKPVKRPLTALEKSALPLADFTPRERCFVYLIYGCGLRREEALAVLPTDISLKKKTIRIQRAVFFDGNNPGIKETKSENGYREIPLPEYLVQFLRGYLPSVDGYLIQKTRGGMITKSSYDKMWENIVDKMNAAAGGSKHVRVITGLTAHVFRHNYCTQLCYQIPKISIKKIAQLLGDTEKMVIEVYNHIIEEQENPVEAIESAIGF